MTEFKRLLTLLSYYNAAEGDSYNEEFQKRVETRRKLKSEFKRLTDLGIDPMNVVKSGNYLVSDSDLRELG